ncbi:hypothetical protein CON00_22935 [Bacillus sp. AFS096315]|nr:hypothetical protein CON00_22935 [Bacillus sp. AFS096315]
MTVTQSVLLLFHLFFDPFTAFLHDSVDLFAVFIILFADLTFLFVDLPDLFAVSAFLFTV